MARGPRPHCRSWRLPTETSREGLMTRTRSRRARCWRTAASELPAECQHRRPWLGSRDSADEVGIQGLGGLRGEGIEEIGDVQAYGPALVLLQQEVQGCQVRGADGEVRRTLSGCDRGAAGLIAVV